MEAVVANEVLVRGLANAIRLQQVAEDVTLDLHRESVQRERYALAHVGLIVGGVLDGQALEIAHVSQLTRELYSSGESM